MHKAQTGRSHLSEDLVRLLDRRRALGLLAGAASLPFLNACANGAAGASDSSSGASACIAWPEETNGPYPADGTNNAQGSLANVLIEAGIVRSDMRQSFAGLSGEAVGVPMQLTLKLVNSANACAPLAGYAVYAWHCTADGLYSIYNLGDQNYLRAVGVASETGEVTFTTIFPGCYMGRVPHIHFEVYPSLEAASAFGNRVLCSQIAFPNSFSEQVYSSQAEYADSISPFRQISLGTDNVFGDNTEAELAAQTASISGDIGGGLSASVLVGIDPEVEPVLSRPGGPDGFPGGRPPEGPPPDGFRGPMPFGQRDL